MESDRNVMLARHVDHNSAVDLLLAGVQLLDRFEAHVVERRGYASTLIKAPGDSCATEALRTFFR